MVQRACNDKSADFFCIDNNNNNNNRNIKIWENDPRRINIIQAWLLSIKCWDGKIIERIDDPRKKRRCWLWRRRTSQSSWKPTIETWGGTSKFRVLSWVYFIWSPWVCFAPVANSDENYLITQKIFILCSKNIQSWGSDWILVNLNLIFWWNALEKVTDLALFSIESRKTIGKFFPKKCRQFSSSKILVTFSEKYTYFNLNH